MKDTVASVIWCCTFLAVLLILFWLLFGCTGCSPKPEKKQLKPTRDVKVLVFVADGCDACIKVKPQIERWQSIGVDVEVIDIHKQPYLTKTYGVTSVPTFVVQVDGREEKTQDVFVVIKALWRGRCD